MKRIKLSEEELSHAMFGLDFPGVCIACGMFDEHAGCEPDAQNYECPECGEHQLFGLEIALAMDVIDIIEED